MICAPLLSLAKSKYCLDVISIESLIGMQRNEIFLPCKFFSVVEVRYLSSSSFSCNIFCEWTGKSLANFQSYEKAKTSKIQRMIKGKKRQQGVVSQMILLADAPFRFLWSIFS